MAECICRRGIYTRWGENEKGIFCASPVGVGIHVQLTAVDLFSVANGTLGTTVPVGVCVAKVPLGAESVVSYATWCVAPEAPAVPAAFSLLSRWRTRRFSSQWCFNF